MMLTLLAAATVAQASGGLPICGVFSGSWESTTEACACVRAGGSSPRWWGGVDLSLDSQDRVKNTCFDLDTVMDTVSGSQAETQIRNAIVSHGTNIANYNSHWWLNGDPESLLSASEVDTWGGGCASCHQGEVPDEAHHWGEEPSQFVFGFDERLGDWTFWTPPSLDLDSELVATVVTDGEVSHALTTDLDEDERLDLLVVLLDGTVCEAIGPFDPSGPVECRSEVADKR